MKRFAAAALVLAFAYAQTEETVDDTKEEAEDQLADAWESTSSWFSAKQEPVAYSSLAAAGDKCSLTGHYGWFQRVGLDFVFRKLRNGPVISPVQKNSKETTQKREKKENERESNH